MLRLRGEQKFPLLSWCSPKNVCTPLHCYPAQSSSFVCNLRCQGKENVEQRLKLVSQLDSSTHLHTLIAFLSSPYL